MKKLIRILYYISILFSLVAAGCEADDEENDTYNFVVISSGGSVSGYYIVDGDPESQTYFSTLSVTGTSYFEFKKNLDAPVSIRIYAYQDSSDVTSVQIYVYDNSTEVASASDTVTETGDTVSATLYYKFSSSTEDSRLQN